MFGNGIFGGMFDLNRDGKMSASESAIEFMFIDEMEREEELESALCDAGIDEFELDCMDAYEREAFFEDAGLDADCYNLMEI